MLNRFALKSRGSKYDRNATSRGRFSGMRASAPCALWMIGTLVLAALPAFAQDAEQPAATTGAELAPEAPLTPEESALLGNALVFDPAALATPPKKPLRLPGTSDRGLRHQAHREAGRLNHRRGEAAAADRMGELGRRRSRSVEHGRERAYDRPLPTDARRLRRRRGLGIGRRTEHRQRGCARRSDQRAGQSWAARSSIRFRSAGDSR